MRAKKNTPSKSWGGRTGTIIGHGYSTYYVRVDNVPPPRENEWFIYRTEVEPLPKEEA